MSVLPLWNSKCVSPNQERVIYILAFGGDCITSTYNMVNELVFRFNVTRLDHENDVILNYTQEEYIKEKL